MFATLGPFKTSLIFAPVQVPGPSIVHKSRKKVFIALAQGPTFYECLYQARELQSSLMFVGKAETYL